MVSNATTKKFVGSGKQQLRIVESVKTYFQWDCPNCCQAVGQQFSQCLYIEQVFLIVYGRILLLRAEFRESNTNYYHHIWSLYGLPLNWRR